VQTLVRTHRVDYLQLFYMGDARGDRRTRCPISGAMKQLAREFEVPVLCLSQSVVARRLERTRNQVSDLRDSGAIEQDAESSSSCTRRGTHRRAHGRPIGQARNGPRLLPAGMVPGLLRFVTWAESAPSRPAARWGLQTALEYSSRLSPEEPWGQESCMTRGRASTAASKLEASSRCSSTTRASPDYRREYQFDAHRNGHRTSRGRTQTTC